MRPVGDVQELIIVEDFEIRFLGRRLALMWLPLRKITTPFNSVPCIFRRNAIKRDGSSKPVGCVFPSFESAVFRLAFRFNKEDE